MKNLAFLVCLLVMVLPHISNTNAQEPKTSDSNDGPKIRRLVESNVYEIYNAQLGVVCYAYSNAGISCVKVDKRPAQE